jgi:hypothetical protein
MGKTISRRESLVLAGAAGAAAAAGPFRPAIAQAAQTLTFGGTIPFSGRWAEIGQSVHAGYQTVVKYVNEEQGGLDVGGRKVRLEIKVVDDASDPQRATTLLQRQIDGARSRVHEVKDLVRTALAHHFLSALQGRLISQSAYAFSKWADAVGMECPAAMSAASGIIAHISATGDTGVDDGSGSFTSTCEGDVDGESRAASSQSPSLRGTQSLTAGVISPALQRLGLTTLAPTPGGRLEVAMPPPDSLSPFSSTCRPTKLWAVMSVKATMM